MYDEDDEPVVAASKQEPAPAEQFALHMLELSAEEIYAIDLSVRNDDVEDDRRVAKPLLLRVGAAWMVMMEPTSPGTIAISVTEPEAWLLRDRVPIMVMVGNKPVGLTLKAKLYRLLMQFDTERESAEVIKSLQVLPSLVPGPGPIDKQPSPDVGQKPKRKRGRPRKEQ